MRSPKGARIVRLTDRNVGTLPALGKRRTDYTDQLLTGFVLRVSPTGHRSYSVIYGTGPEKTRFTIGSIERITLAQAREKAREILAHAELGGDPQADRAEERRKAAASTLRALSESFFAAKPRKRGGQWRLATEAVYRVAFDNYILPRFGKADPDAIKPQEVRLFLDGIAKKVPTMANRVLEAFRRCYTWGLSRGLVTSTPFVGVEKPSQERKAVRTYTNDEIRAMLAAIQGTELEDLVPLIFHTATRSHETRAMRWSQVDLERAIWRIPPHLAKTGEVVQQAHDVPLSKGAVAILKRIQKRQRAAPVVGHQGGRLRLPRPDARGPHGQAEQGDRYAEGGARRRGSRLPASHPPHRERPAEEGSGRRALGRRSAVGPRPRAAGGDVHAEFPAVVDARRARRVERSLRGSREGEA